MLRTTIIFVLLIAMKLSAREPVLCAVCQGIAQAPPRSSHKLYH